MRFQGIQRAVALLVVLLITACSAASTAAPTASPLAVAPSEGLSLVLWHSLAPNNQAVLGRLVSAYNQRQSTVRIIPRAMPRASLSADLRLAALDGSGPHIVLMPSHWLGMLADQQLLLALNSRISAVQLEQLLPATLASAQVRTQGEVQLYGVPISFDTLALFYNKDNVLTAPADTVALLSIARGLTDATTQPPIWGLAYHLSLDRTIGYLYAFGGQVFDAEGRVVLAQEGRVGAERWLQWLLDLQRDAQLLAAADGIKIDGALTTQQALMTIDRADQLATYRALWGQSLGVAPLPVLSDTGEPPAAYVQSEVLSINAQVTDRAMQVAALDFSSYMLSAEAQQQLLEAGMQPVLSDLALEGEAAWVEPARAFRSQATRGLPMPTSRAENDLVWPTLNQMLRVVLQGQLTPADAVTQADSRLRDGLSQK